MADKNFITVTKDGISRTVRANEIYDWERRGWLAAGKKKATSSADLEKSLTKATAELDKAKADLAKAAEKAAADDKAIKELQAEKAALTAELDKAKAELAKAAK